MWSHAKIGGKHPSFLEGEDSNLGRNPIFHELFFRFQLQNHQAGFPRLPHM